MPFKFVPNPLAFTYKGIKIYHTYIDEHAENGKSDLWFSVDENDDEEMQFDIRYLPYIKENFKRSDIDIALNWKKAIKNAIDEGLITEDGYNGDGTYD
jgi:uncharacterized protein YukJ